MSSESADTSAVEFPARAQTWLSVVSVVQFLLAMGFAGLLMMESLREAGVVIAWGMFALPFALVVGAIAGAVTASRDRQTTGRRNGLSWLMRSLASLALATTLPMLLWSPLAAVAAITSSGSRSEKYVVSALFGLGCWAVGVIAGATLWKTRNLSSTRTTRGDGTVALWGELGWALLYTVPSALVVAGVVGDGGDGAGLAWIAVPLVSGITMLVAAPLAWCRAAADMVQARTSPARGDWSGAFSGRLSLLVLTVALPLFGAALMPMWHSASGQRFGIQMATVLIAGATTWVATRWRRSVGSEPVAG